MDLKAYKQAQLSGHYFNMKHFSNFPKLPALLFGSTVAILCLACTHDTNPANMPAILEKSNNSSLKKAYARICRNADSLYIASTHFLLNNMGNKYSYISLPFYKDGVNISQLEQQIGLAAATTKLTEYTKPHIRDRSLVFMDIDSLNGSLLNENLKCSFRAWNYPYARQISFPDFCAYLLPYRYLSEPLSNFKAEIQKQLEPKLGIAYQKYGDDAVIDSLMYYCSRNFRINALYEQFMDGQQAVQEIIHTHEGDAIDDAIFCCAVFNSCGIPAKIMESLTKKWCVIRVHEHWEILIRNDSNQLERKQHLPENYPYLAVLQFSKPTDHISQHVPNRFNIPHRLSRYSTNVTAQYGLTHKCIINLDTNHSNQIIFAGILMKNKWEPVDWALVEKSGKATFNQLSSNCVYALFKFTDGDIDWLDSPYVFILNQEGGLNWLDTNPNHSLQAKICNISLPVDDPFSVNTYQTGYWNGQHWNSINSESTNTHGELKLLVQDKLLYQVNLIGQNNSYSALAFSKFPDTLYTWRLE